VVRDDDATSIFDGFVKSLRASPHTLTREMMERARDRQKEGSKTSLISIEAWNRAIETLFPEEQHGA